MISSMGIRYAKGYTLRGRSSMKLGQRSGKVKTHVLPLSQGSPAKILNNTTSERLPMITTVFAATAPKNTPFAYHASTSTNPNPMISHAFVKANYEVYEDYDEEREMELRLEPHREATPPFSQGLLWSLGNKKELWDLRKHRTGKEAREEGTSK
ncbi:hypothetical protein Tco_1180436, partial [Tanacetum coccineum]